MPLVTCPDCQRQISDAAPSCPGCGRPLAASPISVSSPGGESLGYAILLLPFGATGLIWGWIGVGAYTNKLQDPAGTLNAVGIGTIVATAILIGVEASALGMGKLAIERGRKTGSGPFTWFAAALFMWIVTYPWYLSHRRLYGRKSLVVGGILVAAIFVGSWALTSSEIANMARRRASAAEARATIDMLSSTTGVDARTRARAQYESDRDALRSDKPKTEAAVNAILGRRADSVTEANGVTDLMWFYEDKAVGRDIVQVIIQNGKVTTMSM